LQGWFHNRQTRGFTPGFAVGRFQRWDLFSPRLKRIHNRAEAKSMVVRKKSKIQHFCARKLLKTLGRFFAKSIFSHDLCGIRRDAGVRGGSGAGQGCS
jgi:hypothetical protein